MKRKIIGGALIGILSDLITDFILGNPPNLVTAVLSLVIGGILGMFLR